MGSTPSRTAPISRRSVLLTTTGAALGLGAGAFAQPTETPEPDSLDEAGQMVRRLRDRKGPPVAESVVQNLVVAAHTDLDRVKSLVAEHPNAVNGTVDWGSGDFETPLGAASHMGRPDIALTLLAHRARPDLFTAAMLGWTDVVRVMLEAQPELVNTPGPHGISLLAHAEKGGPAAAAVAELIRKRLSSDEP